MSSTTAHFHGSNMVMPKSSDYAPVEIRQHNAFPAPPPSAFYPIKASSPVDPSITVFDDTKAADYGRFSLPIRGLKRSTRRIVGSGGAGEEIASTVDRCLRDWLDKPEVYIQPDSRSRSEKVILSLRADDSGHESSSSDSCQDATILQTAKQPHSLIWQVEDGFVRFLVHSVARYYRVVSFTKVDPTTNKHLVYLLRPNMQSVRKVAPIAKASFETPPTTEWEASSIASLSNTSDSYITDALDTTTDDDTASDVRSEVGAEETDSETWSVIEGDETIMQIHAGYLPTSRLRNALSTSDIDSGGEPEEAGEADEVASTSGASDLEASLADLRIARTLSRSRAAHPASSMRDDSFSRPPSPSRAADVPRIPHMMGRQDRQTLQMARNSRDRTSTGWRMPTETFLQWVRT
jgi:hypothetical protein